MFVRYQQMLHRNLVYLATIADSNQNAQNAASVRIFTCYQHLMIIT